MLKSTLFLSTLFVLLCSCAAKLPPKQKINGVSFVAASHPADSSHVTPVVAVNANYAAVMPFGFIKDLSNPSIRHNTDRQWFGETRAGAAQYIEELRKKNIKVMIKPQIWVWRGEFTGYIEMKNEADWKVLEEEYTEFIMTYATLANEVNAEIFCIGTELEYFIKARPDYWHHLISEIKKIYKGELTYAANWDEFKRTPFWKSLDYIGVDAYFPVSEEKTPTIETSMAGWQKYKALLKKYTDSITRPILFTEYGYRSVDYAGKQPWNSDHTLKGVNLEAQVNTTQALFETFWKEEWFAGGFIWKWFTFHDQIKGEENNQFTPQNKPAEDVVRSFYGIN